MQEHVYLAVKCKSCGAEIIMNYLGPYSGQKEVGAFTRDWIDFQCGRCEAAHRYERKDLYDRILPTAPPDGFQNRF